MTWTRETLTEQILKDAAGLWKHCEREESFRRSSKELFDGVRGGCIALIEGELRDTKDLLTLAVCMLHCIRELCLEEQETRQGLS